MLCGCACALGVAVWSHVARPVLRKPPTKSRSMSIRFGVKQASELRLSGSPSPLCNGLPLPSRRSPPPASCCNRRTRTMSAAGISFAALSDTTTSILERIWLHTKLHPIMLFRRHWHTKAYFAEVLEHLPGCRQHLQALASSTVGWAHESTTNIELFIAC